MYAVLGRENIKVNRHEQDRGGDLYLSSTCLWPSVIYALVPPKIKETDLRQKARHFRKVLSDTIDFLRYCFRGS